MAPSQATKTLRLNCWTSRSTACASCSTSASGSLDSSCAIPIGSNFAIAEYVLHTRLLTS